MVNFPKSLSFVQTRLADISCKQPFSTDGEPGNLLVDSAFSPAVPGISCHSVHPPLSLRESDLSSAKSRGLSQVFSYLTSWQDLT